MSSHHIIRENQEPPLLVWEGWPVNEQILHGLLEWSPLVIVHEAVFSHFQDHSIKMDALLTENISLNWEALLGWQWPVKVLDLSPKNMETYLKEKQTQSLNIMADFPAFPSDWMNRLMREYTLIFYHGQYKTQYCRNGTFQKWMSPGRRLRVLPQGETGQIVHLGNIHAVDDHHFEADGEGMIKICANGSFWLQELIL